MAICYGPAKVNSDGKPFASTWIARQIPR